MVELHLNPASLAAYSVLVIITQKHQITCLGSHSFSVGSWDYSQFLDSKEGTPACIWGVTVELFSGWLYQNHAANYCLIAIISQELYSNYLPAESSVANKTNKQAKTSRQTRFAESYSSPLNFASSPRPLLRNELLVEYEDRLLLGASPASQAARYIQSVGSDIRGTGIRIPALPPTSFVLFFYIKLIYFLNFTEPLLPHLQMFPFLQMEFVEDIFHGYCGSSMWEHMWSINLSLLIIYYSKLVVWADVTEASKHWLKDKRKNHINCTFMSKSQYLL